MDFEGLDGSITRESVHWLLNENVRAGTVALFWCLKTQVNKIKARAFYKWQQTAYLNKFLSPYRQSIRNGRDAEAAYYSERQPHVEHIVEDTNARSERKLLRKYDY